MRTVALVGCGRISDRHLKVIAQIPELRLVGVCDLQPKRTASEPWHDREAPARLAGGTSCNADTRNIGLLKADGRMLGSGVTRQTVEPGTQRVRRDLGWQGNLAVLTPLATLLNILK